MKNLIIFINILIIIGLAAIFSGSRSQETDVSNQSNKKLAESPSKIRTTEVAGLSDREDNISEVHEFARDFITEMAEARLMDLEEGKIAQQRSTSKDLKSYGTLMVNDQTKMLHDIKKLAALKNIKLPSGLGPAKADGLKDLKEVHGKTFDKKFIKMMISAHKRDVKKLERALRSSDADVQVFATKYLPYVQSHLEKIRSLK